MNVGVVTGGSGKSEDAGRLRQSGGRYRPAGHRLRQAGDARAAPGVGRYLVLGVAGSLAMSVGVVLSAAGPPAVLADRDREASPATSRWMPYLIVTVVASAIIGLCVWRVTDGPAARRRPRRPRKGR